MQILGPFSVCQYPVIWCTGCSTYAIERQIFPARASALETFWLELIGVFAPEVFATVHDMCGVENVGVRFHEDG